MPGRGQRMARPQGQGLLLLALSPKLNFQGSWTVACAAMRPEDFALDPTSLPCVVSHQSCISSIYKCSWCRYLREQLCMLSAVGSRWVQAVPLQELVQEPLTEQYLSMHGAGCMHTGSSAPSGPVFILPSPHSPISLSIHHHIHPTYPPFLPVTGAQCCQVRLPLPHNSAC